MLHRSGGAQRCKSTGAAPLPNNGTRRGQHAGDTEAAAAIETLVGKCEVSREAQTRNGRDIRPVRPTAGHCRLAT